jgi:hypothetical protein
MKHLAYTILILLVAWLVWYAIARYHSTAADNVPKSMEEFRQRSGGLFTAEAGAYLMELAKAGKLPGFALGEHGTMHAGILDANANTPSGSEPYPLSRGIQFQKDGDTSGYFYIVVRESQGSPLRLQKAWRMDAEGHVVENYSVL